MKPPELILILIHGQKVNTMTLSWMRTIDLRKMTAQMMIVMQTRLKIVKKRLHLKLPLLNVISVQGHMWKRQVIKEKRLKGESYKNATGQERQPKTMGPPCTSQHCLRSEKRSCELLSEEERTDIFNNFWSMPSWETRKLYIQTLVENVPIKQKKGGVASKRKTSRSYHLQLADRCKLPVFKILFCSTLGFAPRTIGSWLTVDMKTKTDPPKSKINKTGPHMPISDADQTFLKEWLSGLPTVPSHYCRQVPSYQDKKFVEPGTVLSDLHKEYQKAAGKSGARVVSETYF